ncbi:hypothetical protein DMH88_10105 [Escherichia coli]|nr:hypothetical protein [Escherichia coli]
MDRGNLAGFTGSIAGHEQSGKRPVLIVSKASFNKLTRLPVVVPLPAAETSPVQPVLPSHWTVREQNNGRYSLRPAQNH